MKNHSLLFALCCCNLFISINTFGQTKEVKSSEIQNLKEDSSSKSSVIQPVTHEYNQVIVSPENQGGHTPSNTTIILKNGPHGIEKTILTPEDKIKNIEIQINSIESKLFHLEGDFQGNESEILEKRERLMQLKQELNLLKSNK